MRPVVRVALAFVSLAFAASATSRAVLLYSTDQRNTTAPTGSLANSGWQYQGDFNGFLGTVIAKKFIITAGHIGGKIGDNFIYNGELHRTVQVWGDPKSDLRIYQTVGSFYNPSPIFRDQSEQGRSVVMFGRGTPRGDAVTVNGVTKGWKWGAYDGVQSWGRNGVTAITTSPAGGYLLKMNFDPAGGNEGALTYGDSGGGVFVSQGGHWKLAGINYGVDGQFSTNSNGSSPFDASIFDRTGLWQQGIGYTPTIGSPTPTASYATRVSTRIDWIWGVLSGTVAPGIPDTSGGGGGGSPAPEPTGAVSILIVAAMAMSRRRRANQ